MMIRFLMKHDRRTKRLRFLWGRGVGDSSSMKGSDESLRSKCEPGGSKCGCVGGSRFFGSNVSGTRFFWPSRKDWADGVNVACFR